MVNKKKESNKMTKTVFNIDEDLFFRFKMQALKERRPMTKIFAELIENYLTKKTEEKEND
jgi:hypothetical protein